MRPAEGGIRTHVTTILQLLDRSTFDPVLLAPDPCAVVVPTDVRKVRCEIGSKGHPLRDAVDVAAFVPRLSAADLLHCHGLRALAIAGFAARLRRMPYGVTLHNLAPALGSRSRRAAVWLLNGAEFVIGVSQAVLDSFGSMVPTDAQVVPNGVAPADADPRTVRAVREQFGIAADDPLLVAVGRLAPEKGFDLLLDAFATIRFHVPSTRLIIIGAGSEQCRLAATLPAGAALAGHSDNPAAYLAAADVVAVPSRSEGQGIVAIEAMLQARAVVAFDVGGLRETILDGETGLLAKAGDPAALADGIRLVLTNRQLAARMGENGRMRALEHYSATKMVRSLEAIYGQAFQSNGASEVANC